MKITLNIKSLKVTDKSEINDISMKHEILPGEIKANIEMTKEHLPKIIEIMKKGMLLDQLESKRARIRGLESRKNHYKSLIKNQDFSLFSKESIENEINEINKELEELGEEITDTKEGIEKEIEDCKRDIKTLESAEQLEELEKRALESLKERLKKLEESLGESNAADNNEESDKDKI